jgi:hypothetical protein
VVAIIRAMRNLKTSEAELGTPQPHLALLLFTSPNNQYDTFSILPTFKYDNLLQ